MKGSDAVAQAIEEESGVVFGLPGESVLDLYETLGDYRVENVLMRDEGSCVHAADGFARASGRVGVCMATHGPGAMNMALGIATAYKDSVPLVALSGQLPAPALDGEVFQALDSYRVYASITKSSFRAAALPADVARAFSLARAGRPGPVFLELPMDLMEAPAAPYRSEPAGRPGPREEEMAAFIRALEGAGRPLVLLGGGVIAAGAEDEAREFLDITGFPAVTTMMGRGVIPEDSPGCLGPVGTRGRQAANDALGQADLLVVLGARMSDRTARYVPPGLERFVVNVDGGDSASDVGEFLKAANQRLRAKGFRPRPLWTAPPRDAPPPWQGAPGTSWQAVKEIYGVIGDETVVVDPGQYTMWALTLRTVRRPREVIFSGSFAPMGFALPAAVGVHFAGRRPVVITGDGSLAMAPHELATVREMDIPMVICVMNNRGYGIIRQRQEELYGRGSHVDFEVPDFQALAGAYGIESARVAPQDVGEELAAALRSGEPFLLEIVLEREEMPMPD
ncbi:MAG: thiamine pyrophosphate-binding protein [Acidobacteria bacterium]|nr:thiamine pyrophosphate-binding protein [Acidobacteriota bacterium]